MTHEIIREAIEWAQLLIESSLPPERCVSSGDEVKSSEEIYQELEAARCALTTQGWRTDMENAPPNTDLLLYCPYRAESNPERIECGQFRNTRGGWQHSWATAWMLPPELPAPPTPNEE